MDDRPRYMISVAAELVGMHPQTLRIYEMKGLVQPKRTSGNTRLYSDADVERLQLIQRLTTEIGLNLAGVERVLHLEDELQRARRRLDRLEQEMRSTIAEGHRSYRRDLVLYRPSQSPAPRPPSPPARHTPPPRAPSTHARPTPLQPTPPQTPPPQTTPARGHPPPQKCDERSTGARKRDRRSTRRSRPGMSCGSRRRETH